MFPVPAPKRPASLLLAKVVDSTKFLNKNDFSLMDFNTAAIGKCQCYTVGETTSLFSFTGPYSSLLKLLQTSSACVSDGYKCGNRVIAQKMLLLT